MLQPSVHPLDKLFWEETTLVFEGPYQVQLMLQPHDPTTYSSQVATFTVPSNDFNFATCNTPRAIFTTFPTFYKRCSALQLPGRTNCKMTVVVAGPVKWEFSVEGSIHEFCSFGVTVIF